MNVFSLQDLKKLKTIPYMVMEVDAETLRELQNNPEIQNIQEDIPVPPTLLQSIPFINADDVHDMGYDGSGYAIAILDTGVRSTHEFFNGKVVFEACYSSDTGNSTSLCPDGEESRTGTGAGANCNTSISGCDHGTHVAGIAAGTGGSPGTGLAPGANIIAIQVFSKFTSEAYCGVGNAPCVLSYTSDQILGLERVYALRNTYSIVSVNMSLGGGQYSSYCDSDLRKDIIDNLRSVGIATVIASGNDYYDGSVSSPGCISSAVTVGATADNSNTVSSYSNHEDMVDLMAPGSSIYASIADSDTSYGTKSGTSMATPHVAGAFAVMKQRFSSWTVSDIETTITGPGTISFYWKVSSESGYDYLRFYIDGIEQSSS
ncbi:MAG: S8 family serine peptidase, partial [bacterium]|nr:S8 family serine peptidase [bacterium]